MKMELYHGAVAGTNLTVGNIDPLRYSSGRTPLPAFTLGEEGVARQYAETGGVGQQKVKAGPLYKVGLEFDSPERIRKADDLASDEFIDFMRSSLPEEGTPNYSSEIMRKIQSKKTVRFRDIFDENIKNLKPEERTIHGVMQTLNDVHEFYRPLEKYDYLPRGQASIEARRFGIDALTWNDWGDDVVALLDPDDIRSNVGRRNITSIAPIGATKSTLPEPILQSKAEGVKVGKPVPQPKSVIPASQAVPPTPRVVAEKVTQTANAAKQGSAEGRVFVAGQQAASTTSTTQAKITNQVIDDMVSKPSTGAPLKATSKTRGAADNLSASVAKGTKNFGNLKMMGLAAAVGLGAAAYGGVRRTQQDNVDRRLEMQRRGIVK